MVKNTLCHDEPACQRALLLAPFLLGALQDLFKTLHVIMVIPSNGAPGDLQALLDGKVDTSVRYDDVTTFAERRNDRADG